MAQLSINIPDELKIELEESNLDVSDLVRELIALKVFEKQLSKSRALQRAVLESLIAKSKLTEQGAKELADQIDKGMLEELKHKFSGL